MVKQGFRSLDVNYTMHGTLFCIFIVHHPYSFQYIVVLIRLLLNYLLHFIDQTIHPRLPTGVP